MKTVVAWFTRNTVASNLLMMFLVLGGLGSLTTVKMELFPEFSMETVSVSVVYPGAAPEEVEEGICVKIEEEIDGVQGIKQVSSTSVEGAGTVLIEVLPGEDPRRVLDDVKTRVDAIDTFPEEAEEPVIQELLMRQQVINIAIFGPAEEAVLKSLAQRLRDELVATPAISQAQMANTREYEISIELSETQMRRFGVSFDEVARAVRSSSLDLSGGSVKTEAGEILLRTKAQAYDGSDFEELVVRTEHDGSRVLVRDLATVVDGFVDADLRASFNGQPMSMVQVFRVGDESALAVSAACYEVIDRLRAELPEGIQIEAWQDQAIWLEGRLNLLLKNGAQGLFLVFLVLALFLRFRLSFWVTLGIPISFLGVLLVMPSLDASVNMLSLFAFILVLGIVVDDAIVVGENIHNEQENGNPGVAGAVRGVQGVAVPVVFAVLTTIVAFLPMLGLPGMMGKFFRITPIIVIPALLFSLVESQLILPAHLSHSSKWGDRIAKVAPFRWWVRFQGAFANATDRFADRVYQPLLNKALEWRYATLALAIASLVVTMGLITGGRLKFEFFPPIESDIVVAQLTMPQGTSVERTEQAVAQIEAAAMKLVEELEGGREGEGPAVIQNFMASVGEQPFLAQQQWDAASQSSFVGAHLGEVVMELVLSEKRDIRSAEVVRRWREYCGSVLGAVELSFKAELMSMGRPIELELSGRDIDELRAASGEIQAALAGYNGVFDISDSFRGGKEELVLDIRPEAEALGLSRRDLARQVRQGFYGEEAQRVQRGSDDLKVMVRYPAEDRRSLQGVRDMRVRTPLGDEVPFSSVARAKTRRGYSTIRRTDRQRTINVKADIDNSVANANDILADLGETVLPALASSYPGVTVSLEGQSREQGETVNAMLRLYALALFGIYGLMAIPFRSYIQPLIVMTAIPFGVVGALLGHLLLGQVLSMLSILGVAALAGVVVNDSLVLVDYVNRKRSEGLSISEAARLAGRARFRPILLTSLTTFVGLIPLILEKSVQAQFLVPMAISLAFGVLYSTLITLLFLPCSYLILEDLVRLPRRILRRAPATPALEKA